METLCVLVWMVRGEQNGVVHGHVSRSAQGLLEVAEIWLSKFKSTLKIPSLAQTSLDSLVTSPAEPFRVESRC